MTAWNVYPPEQKSYDYYKIGNLETPEQSSLDSIKKILLNSKEPRLILAELYSDNIKSNDSREIEEKASILLTPFEAIWSSVSKALHQSKKTIDSVDFSVFSGKIQEIAHFLDSGFNLDATIDLYLIQNHPSSSPVGHQISQTNFILLHPTGVELANQKDTNIGTVIHEYLHMIEFNSKTSSQLCKNSFEKIIKPTNVDPPKGYTWKQLYFEVIVYCFANNITGGLFRPEIFNKPSLTVKESENGFRKLYTTGEYTTPHLIAWVALNIQDSVMQYMNNQRKIDNHIVSMISRMFLEFIVDKK